MAPLQVLERLSVERLRDNLSVLRREHKDPTVTSMYEFRILEPCVLALFVQKGDESEIWRWTTQCQRPGLADFVTLELLHRAIKDLDDSVNVFGLQIGKVRVTAANKERQEHVETSLMDALAGARNDTVEEMRPPMGDLVIACIPSIDQIRVFLAKIEPGVAKAHRGRKILDPQQN